MLLDVNIKLLVINMYPNSSGSEDKANALVSAAKAVYDQIIRRVPFPLEIDINNFSLYNDLDELTGTNSFLSVGNVVSNVSANITLNTVQKKALLNFSDNFFKGMPLNDDKLKQITSIKQHPKGKKLHLKVTFEPKSLLPGILFAYLEAAFNNVQNYTFDYISSELIVNNMVLSKVVPNYSTENTEIDMEFIEKLQPEDGINLLKDNHITANPL